MEHQPKKRLSTWSQNGDVAGEFIPKHTQKNDNVVDKKVVCVRLGIIWKPLI